MESRHLLIAQNDGLSGTPWEEEFTKIGHLQGGWNGYTAPAPSELAIDLARSFVDELIREKYEPRRLAPSAVGGVGVTQQRGDRSVYVEFYNDGRVLALFSDDVNEPDIKRIEPGYQPFKKLIAEMRDYLEARTSRWDAAEGQARRSGIYAGRTSLPPGAA